MYFYCDGCQREYQKIYKETQGTESTEWGDKVVVGKREGTMFPTVGTQVAIYICIYIYIMFSLLRPIFVCRFAVGHYAIAAYFSCGFCYDIF